MRKMISERKKIFERKTTAAIELKTMIEVLEELKLSLNI